MITQDDILYMIVTDRFQDGDPDNDPHLNRGAPKGRHGGDLLGIVQRMPYLQRLGVTALWLTPVYPNPPGSYHGYHPLDFEKVAPYLCSEEIAPGNGKRFFARFVATAHENRLKIVLDAVVNHTAKSHPWFSERPDWFNEHTPTLEKHWVWGLPDLNHDNLEVNVYFTRNVIDWVRATKVDGLRLDAARHVETQFWSMFKLFSQGLCPDVTVIGEVWDEVVAHVAPFQVLHGFDSMFDFPLQAAMVDVFAKDASFGRIARPELSPDEPQGVLNMDKAYRNAYHLVTFLENHDVPRFFHVAGGAKKPAEALRRNKLALTFLLTTRGIPQLYYGAELAMRGGWDPDNRRDMPWHLIDGPPTASAEAARAHEMFAFTHELIRLRRESMALRYGLLITLYVTPDFYAFARVYPEDVRIVALNNRPEPQEVLIPLHRNPRMPRLALELLPEGATLVDELRDGSITVESGSIRVRLEARQGAVYRAPLA